MPTLPGEPPPAPDPPALGDSRAPSQAPSQVPSQTPSQTEPLLTHPSASSQLLREQRELITFVQRAAHAAFWSLDLATGALTFDIGSYPVFGHPFSHIGSVHDFQALLHPSDAAQVMANTQRATDTGELVVNQFRILDQHGDIRWLEARLQAVFRDGAAIALGGMTVDITDRMRGLEALAASEERYRVLAELSPQVLWTGSPQGAITYVNQGFLDYLGFTLDDLAGEKWLTAFVPEDRPRVLEAWTHSIATGVDYQVEARLCSAAGEAHWWWLRALPLRDKAGHIVNWLGAAIDIHDRKTAADALLQKQLETERQRAEIATVYRTAPIGLALFDPVEFRYLRLNDRQAEILGLPIEQAIGRTLTEIAPIPGLHEMFQQVAAGRPIRGALLQGELPTRPGEHRFWNVNYFPVYNADGSVQAISAASLEVTNQKKAEIALIQSEKLAAVGRLASSISHEINNPLEAVTNLLYLIAHTPELPGEIRSYVDLAQSELQRVCQIATQTLRFHRQAARATLVTPEELVTAVLHLYQGRLVNSNITVETRYRTSATLLCFENDIRQVLNNLIANAIDAMRPGGGHLILRARDATGVLSPTASASTATQPVAQPVARPVALATTQPTALPVTQPVRGICITIADTGHGMPGAVRTRIFEPFFTTKDLNGTGLGLWISNGIITRHRGRITVRSSVNPQTHGTVFSLFLPHIAESDIEETDTIPL
jgi:PAS domain S-box-containing protein